MISQNTKKFSQFHTLFVGDEIKITHTQDESNPEIHLSNTIFKVFEIMTINIDHTVLTK